jgi:tRNA (cmo5U34)-methyltransferase
MKSTVDQIRDRFDNDVERFSNLETGQTAAVDSPIALDLIAKSAAACTLKGVRLLDIGCGAGNFSLRLLQHLELAEITLIDLSRPMLDRACERIRVSAKIEPRTIQGDIREIELAADGFDVVLAGAVMHHLRTDDEWQSVFQKVYDSAAPGGSFWLFDMATSVSQPVDQLLWERYGDHLVDLKDEAYRDHVLGYIEAEDTPRPLMEQLDLLRDVGFRDVDVLHRNTIFAAFGGVK